MHDQPFTRNPPGSAGLLLDELNRAFPGWGDAAEFDWWFRRRVGGPRADLLVLGRPDEPVAGMAVSYRRVGAPDGSDRLVGVLTGAWTVPGHRRQGCFAELVLRAQETAAERGAVALLGFARRERASIATLERASLGTLPAWWLRAPGGGPPATACASARPGAADLHRWFHAHRRGAGMRYPSAAVFAEQMRLESPSTSLVAAGERHWAIVRDGIVQALVATLPEPTRRRPCARWRASRAPPPRP